MTVDEGPGTFERGVRWVSGDAVQRLTFGLTILVGVVYLAGYVARSSYLASLGLGSFSSSRESLVGTGAGLLWNAIPFGLASWMLLYLPLDGKRRFRRGLERIAVYLVVAVGVAVVSASSMARPDLGGAGGPFTWGLLHSWGTFLSVSVVGIVPLLLSFRPKKVAPEDYPVYLGGALVSVCTIFAFVYGRSALPVSGPVFGGLVLEDVTVDYKEGPQGARRLLIASDDKAAILGVNLTRGEYLRLVPITGGERFLERVAWDDLRAVRRRFGP